MNEAVANTAGAIGGTLENAANAARAAAGRVANNVKLPMGAGVTRAQRFDSEAFWQRNPQQLLRLELQVRSAFACAAPAAHCRTALRTGQREACGACFPPRHGAANSSKNGLLVGRLRSSQVRAGPYPGSALTGLETTALSASSASVRKPRASASDALRNMLSTIQSPKECSSHGGNALGRGSAPSVGITLGSPRASAAGVGASAAAAVPLAGGPAGARKPGGAAAAAAESPSPGAPAGEGPGTESSAFASAWALAAAAAAGVEVPPEASVAGAQPATPSAPEAAAEGPVSPVQAAVVGAQLKGAAVPAAGLGEAQGAGPTLLTRFRRSIMGGKSEAEAMLASPSRTLAPSGDEVRAAQAGTLRERCWASSRKVPVPEHCPEAMAPM
jgi:hypothetical protein